MERAQPRVEHDALRAREPATHRRRRERVRRASPTDARVVDLGSGAGHYPIVLARRGLQVTGIDYADAMLSRARDAAAQPNVDVDFRTADLDAPLPYAPNTFDAALCISVLQVINNPSAFLSNVHAVLKHDGAFAIEQVNYWGRSRTAHHCATSTSS